MDEVEPFLVRRGARKRRTRLISPLFLDVFRAPIDANWRSTHARRYFSKSAS